MASFRESRPALPLCEVGSKRKHRVNQAMEEYKENLGPAGNLRSKRARLEQPVKPHNSAVTSLQEQIEREYKIREGAAKLLQASKNTRQSMEASKGLFVSNAKIIALMKELQQRQAEGGGKASNSDQLRPCNAKIAISEIRIPLEWREFESTKGKIDPHARHGVFCLFKVGNQVMDTPSLMEVDRSTMDIIFRDSIIFPEKVGPEFVLEVEVYCSVPVDDPPSSKPSTPIKMLRKFSKSKERVEDSPALISSVPQSPYAPCAFSITPSHRFVLAGYTQLGLKDVSTSCSTYQLRRGAVGASGTASTSGHNQPLLPLWGQLCCKLMAEPDCVSQPRITGFINVQRMVGGLPDWIRLWCVMRQHHLRCWNYPEDVGRRMPVHSLDLTETMVVEPAPRLSMRRPNALLLRDQHSMELVYLAFESREEKQQWMGTIHQAILDLRVWGASACDYIIPVPSSKFYVESPSKEPLPSITTPHKAPPTSTVRDYKCPGSRSPSHKR